MKVVVYDSSDLELVNYEGCCLCFFRPVYVTQRYSHAQHPCHVQSSSSSTSLSHVEVHDDVRQLKNQLNAAEKQVSSNYLRFIIKVHNTCFKVGKSLLAIYSNASPSYLDDIGATLKKIISYWSCQQQCISQ